MKLLRFGALLVNQKKELAFYLSHRIVLTVPEPGPIKALTQKEFKASSIFAHNGVALQFPEEMLSVIKKGVDYENSLQMLKVFSEMPNITSLTDLIEFIKKKYDGNLVSFSLKSEVKEKLEINKEKEEKMENYNSQLDSMENYDGQQDFFEKFEDAKRKFNKRPNILVCGYTGSGKTSLIRALLGNEIVSADKIGAGTPKTMNYDCYENEHIVIWDSKGLEAGETEEEFTTHTRAFIRDRQNDPDIDKHVHLVWYTIQGPGARVTDCDKNLIRNIFNTNNVIVAITKNDVTRDAQREALKAEIMSAGVPDERIIFTSDEEGGSQGCAELMKLSLAMLPEAYRDAFVEAQRIDRELKIQTVYGKDGKANAIITGATATAVAIGATPIPLSDAALLVPVQMGMIAGLAGLYGLGKEAVKQSALPFIAKVAGMMTATSLLKLIPFLGSAVNATVAGTFTGAMGLYVKNSFEKIAIAKIKGEKAPELIFDAETFRSFYEEYKKNK